MSATLEDAIALATEKFRGITDKSGQPYLLHCVRVMTGVEGTDAKTVAVMHDLVEDTPVTLDDLREMGFSDDVIEGVARMSHESDIPYTDYVIRLKEHPLARQVKLSDLRDNLSLDRVLLRRDRIEKDVNRITKYLATYRFLTDAIGLTEYRDMMRYAEASGSSTETD